MIPVRLWTKGLCFSCTSFFSNMLIRTGTSVRVVINAPNKAKPSVKARGENIFPSTFWKANMGSKPVIMITLAKKIALPN